MKRLFILLSLIFSLNLAGMELQKALPAKAAKVQESKTFSFFQGLPDEILIMIINELLNPEIPTEGNFKQFYKKFYKDRFKGFVSTDKFNSALMPLARRALRQHCFDKFLQNAYPENFLFSHLLDFCARPKDGLFDVVSKLDQEFKKESIGATVAVGQKRKTEESVQTIAHIDNNLLTLLSLILAPHVCAIKNQTDQWPEKYKFVVTKLIEKICQNAKTKTFKVKKVIQNLHNTVISESEERVSNIDPDLVIEIVDGLKLIINNLIVKKTDNDSSSYYIDPKALKCLTANLISHLNFNYSLFGVDRVSIAANQSNSAFCSAFLRHINFANKVLSLEEIKKVYRMSNDFMQDDDVENFMYLLEQQGITSRFSPVALRVFFANSIFSNSPKIRTALLQKYPEKSLVGYVYSNGNMPLHVAVKNGNLDAINQIIDRDKDQILKMNAKGASPMSIAVGKGFDDIVKLFLDKLGNTGLMDEVVGKIGVVDCKLANICSAAGNIELLKYLVEKDRRYLEQMSEEGHTNLMSALAFVQIDAFKWLINEDAALMDQKDNELRNVLHYEASLKHANGLEIVKIIFEKRPNLAKEQNNKGETPLITAICYNRNEVAKFILKECPECAFIADLQNNTAFHHAVQAENIEILEALLPIHKITTGLLGNLKENLYDEKNNNGRNGVAYAVALDKLESFKFLTSKFNHSEKDLFFIALDALINKSNKIFAHLVENNKSLVKFADDAKCTLLMYACHYGNLDAVKLLLEMGADKAKKDANGYTPYMIASQANQLSIADYILHFEPKK